MPSEPPDFIEFILSRDMLIWYGILIVAFIIVTALGKLSDWSKRS